MMKTGNNREKKEKKSSKSRSIVELGILYNATTPRSNIEKYIGCVVVLYLDTDQITSVTPVVAETN
jgi:hypothetical protein